jgi:hypothetical protein
VGILVPLSFVFGRSREAALLCGSVSATPDDRAIA